MFFQICDEDADELSMLPQFPAKGLSSTKPTDFWKNSLLEYVGDYEVKSETITPESSPRLCSRGVFRPSVDHIYDSSDDENDWLGIYTGDH